MQFNNKCDEDIVSNHPSLYLFPCFLFGGWQRHSLQQWVTVSWALILFVSLSLTRSQAVARIADHTAKNCRGHVTKATPTFRENYLCACSAFQIQSCIPNLKSLAQVVFEILRSKHIGVKSLTFRVTWRHRSRDHSIAHMPFPIGSPLEPSLYL